ncbi:MAG: cation transporter [Chitinophagaceae bacterium]|nr:cation transporter [Chitinophagaceae bacterium]
MPVRIQRYIALLSVVLFGGKMLAWWLTGSVTVLTDALEGIVNVVAGFLGLFSVVMSARPRDTNHPYGHGKVEFISSAVEGTLIIVAGLLIIYEAIHQLMTPHTIQHLDIGLMIVTGAGALNFAAGKYAVRQGKKLHSMVLESAGSHLLSDAYSTIAVVVGVGLLLITNGKYPWLDSAVALVFAVVTIVTGYRVLRKSLSGMMDEMDMGTLAKVIDLLQKNRKAQWVDLHNLRVIHYGELLHIDAHLTLPWYQKVEDADREIHALETLIQSHFSNRVELFIHIDSCMHYQCRLCSMQDCPERKEPFAEQLEWNTENVWADAKHGKG